MYVSKRSWIEAGPGLGQVLDLPGFGPDNVICEYGRWDADSDSCVVDSGGQTYQVSSTVRYGGIAPAPGGAGGGGLCLNPLFPFIGTKVPGTNVCKSAITVPDPWGKVITIGLVALLFLGLTSKKGRR